MPSYNADYNSNRGPSNGLWHNPAHPCPWNRIQDEMIGISLSDDFHTFDATDTWVVTQASSGTAAVADNALGVLLLTAGATTDHQGIQIQRAAGATVGELFTPAAGKHIWFECRLKVETISASTGPQAFYGLAVIDTTVIGTGANSTANHIGFGSVSDDGILLGMGEKAGAAHTAIGESHQLVSDTYVKLGFFVNGVTEVKFFVNGVHDSDENLATAAIPIVEMVPTFVCQAEDVTNHVTSLDWYRIAQLTETGHAPSGALPTL